MRSIIRNIGTSKGIIIPASIINEYHLTDEVELKPVKEGIMLLPLSATRAGWKEDAKQIGKARKAMLLPDVFEDESFDDIKW